jgi:2'-5' RNA ligase
MARAAADPTRQLRLDFGAELPALRAPPKPWARPKPRGEFRAGHLLFLGLVPDLSTRGAIVDCVMGLGERHRLTGRFRPAELLHLTLFGVLGSEETIPDYVISALQRVIGRVAAPAFELTLDRAMSFRSGESKPFVLSCQTAPPALLTLRQGLMDEVRGLFPRLGQSSFKPHVTLLYDKRQVAEADLPRPIRWPVRDFVLVHSFQGQSRHDHLARWPLRG